MAYAHGQKGDYENANNDLAHAESLGYKPEKTRMNIGPTSRSLASTQQQNLRQYVCGVEPMVGTIH